MDKQLVLFLSDDDGLIQLVKLVLGEAGITIVVTGDTSTLLRQLNYVKANLLLVDTAISHALDVIRQVKSSSATREIPVVALAYDYSVYPDEQASEARASGADDILLKPFDTDTLVEKVRKHLYK